MEVEKGTGFLSVRWMDNGRGIEKSIADQLFSAPVVSTRSGGKGEGCYESRKILSRRGGLIRLEETPDGWSTLVYLKLLRTG